MVYDGLLAKRTARNAAKEYLCILELAAKESENLVDQAIGILLHTGAVKIDSTAVKQVYRELKQDNQPRKIEIHIPEADLGLYDQLFTNQEVSWTTLN